MPSSLVQRIRTMKIFAVIELTCTIIGLIALVLGAEVILVGSGIQVGIVLLCISVCSISAIMCLSRHIKCMETNVNAHVIQLNNMSLQSIIDAFGASVIGNKGYVAFQSIEKIDCRILIQHITHFDNSALVRQRKQLNRAINTVYQVKAKVSMYEAFSSLRINVIVCEKASPAVYKHLGQNAAKLLSRNESVVQIAIVLDEQVLLFPDCISALSLSQVRRYQIAAHCVCDALVAH